MTGAAEAGSRQDTGRRWTGSDGLWRSSTATALCIGSQDRPTQRSTSTVENGSSWPGSPTNNARWNRGATRNRASERIWYASSTIAHGHDPSVTVAHLAAVAMVTAGAPRSVTLAPTRQLGWA